MPDVLLNVYFCVRSDLCRRDLSVGLLQNKWSINRNVLQVNSDPPPYSSEAPLERLKANHWHDVTPATDAALRSGWRWKELWHLCRDHVIQCSSALFKQFSSQPPPPPPPAGRVQWRFIDNNNSRATEEKRKVWLQWKIEWEIITLINYLSIACGRSKVMTLTAELVSLHPPMCPCKFAGEWPKHSRSICFLSWLKTRGRIHHQVGWSSNLLVSKLTKPNVFNRLQIPNLFKILSSLFSCGFLSFCRPVRLFKIPTFGWINNPGVLPLIPHNEHRTFKAGADFGFETRKLISAHKWQNTAVGGLFLKL